MPRKKLLDEIVEKVEVVLPDSLVEKQLQNMIEREREKLERQGKDPDTLGTEDELKEKFRSEAEAIVKSQLVLLEIAEKEEITVSNEEVEQKIAITAYQMGVDPQILREFYIKNNMMFALRDSIIADKAMEKVYEYAEIEYEEDGAHKEASEEAEVEDSSQDKEQDS